MKSLLIFLILLINQIFSHPVIWKGGSEFIVSSFHSGYDIQALYSFDRSTAAGIRYLDYYKSPIYQLSLNRRFFRINQQKSQQNFYGLFGVGIEENNLITNVGFQWDWESQRYFTMVSLEEFSHHYFDFKSRVGLAPYVGEFEDVHTWLMLEYHYNEFSNESNILPVVRFFKLNYLLEVGFGNKYFVTLMMHL